MAVPREQRTDSVPQGLSVRGVSGMAEKDKRNRYMRGMRDHHASQAAAVPLYSHASAPPGPVYWLTGAAAWLPSAFTIGRDIPNDMLRCKRPRE